MSLTHEMCCLIKLHVDMLKLFKRLLTNDVNAKDENGKISFAFSM
jgi:hypothetical protein